MLPESLRAWVKALTIVLNFCETGSHYSAYEMQSISRFPLCCFISLKRQPMHRCITNEKQFSTHGLKTKIQLESKIWSCTWC